MFYIFFLCVLVRRHTVKWLAITVQFQVATGRLVSAVNEQIEFYFIFQANIPCMFVCEFSMK